MANETDRRLVLLDIQVQGLADIQKAARELGLASNEARKAGQNFDKFGKETKTGIAAMGGASTVLRNTSAQLQDFAVQVGFGTSVMQAFAQQAPQFFSSLGGGALGTVLGTVIAITAAFPALKLALEAFTGSADASAGSASRLDSSVSSLHKVVSDLEKTTQKFDTDKMIEELAALDVKTRASAVEQIKLQQIIARTGAIKSAADAYAKFNEIGKEGIFTKGADQNILDRVFGSQSNLQKYQEIIRNTGTSMKEVQAVGNAMNRAKTGGIIDEADIKLMQDFVTKGLKSSNAATQEASTSLKEYLDTQIQLKQGLQDTDKILTKVANNDFSLEKITGGKGGGGKSKVTEVKDEFVEWQKSLQKAMDAAALAPRKIAFLQEQMANLAVAGQTGSDAFKILADALQQLDKNKTLDPFADVRKSAETLDAAPEKIAAVTNELSRLYALGVDNNLTEGLQDFKRTLEESIDPMKAYANSLKDQQVELDKMPEKLAVIQRMLAEGVISPQVADNATAALQNMNDTLTDTEKAIKQVSTTAIGGLFGAIVDGVGQAKRSFGEMAASFLANVTKMIMNKAVEKLMDLLFSSGMLKSVTGALGGFFGGANAKGNVFSNGRVTAFANGGIVTRPTLFPMARGMGLMGEAGAEAIMPLRRGADGKLGVSGGGVVINIFNNGDNEVKTKTSEQSDGTKQIDMYITKVAKDAIFGGGSDKLFRNAFGLSRQAG